ncbi:murein biosynthesis integral membrane protein MurJ, partial [Desulfovibrio sp. DS-1]
MTPPTAQAAPASTHSANAGPDGMPPDGMPPDGSAPDGSAPGNTSPDNTSMARNAATVAGATLVSRVLGYARDALTAHILGAGAGADAFFVAFRLPNLMRRLLGEGAVSLAFTPAYVRLREGEGNARAFAFGRGVVLRALLPLALLCLAGMALAHPLALLLAPGFGAQGAPPGMTDRAAHLLRICLPYGVAATCAALCAGMLHAHGRFLPPALAPAVLNLVVMATGGLALAGFGDAATLLACGVLAGGVAQLGLQLSALHPLGLRWRAPLPRSDPQAGDAARALPAGVFGASAQQLNVLACTLLASFLSEGSVTALYYAERLMEFPLGVFGVAVGVAALPVLSAQAAQAGQPATSGPTGASGSSGSVGSVGSAGSAHPHDGFRRVLGDALRLSLFISLPSALGLAAVAVPLVALLFGHGAFDRQAVDATVAALLAYAPGIPAFAVTRPLLAACNAR